MNNVGIIAKYKKNVITENIEKANRTILLLVLNYMTLQIFCRMAINPITIENTALKKLLFTNNLSLIPIISVSFSYFLYILYDSYPFILI